MRYVAKGEGQSEFNLETWIYPHVKYGLPYEKANQRLIVSKVAFKWCSQFKVVYSCYLCNVFCFPYKKAFIYYFTPSPIHTFCHLLNLIHYFTNSFTHIPSHSLCLTYPIFSLSHTQGLEVGSEYDVKEQTFRNWGSPIGPINDITVITRWAATEVEGEGMDEIVLNPQLILSDPTSTPAAIGEVTLDHKEQVRVLLCACVFARVYLPAEKELPLCACTLVCTFKL